MTQLFMRSRKVLVELYDEFKYTASENKTEITYDYVTGFEVVAGKEAEEIEAETDADGIDDLHEYLVLFFEDGTTSTFRNSYVDLFVI